MCHVTGSMRKCLMRRPVRVDHPIWTWGWTVRVNRTPWIPGLTCLVRCPVRVNRTLWTRWLTFHVLLSLRTKLVFRGWNRWLSINSWTLLHQQPPLQIEQSVSMSRILIYSKSPLPTPGMIAPYQILKWRGISERFHHKIFHMRILG